MCVRVCVGGVARSHTTQPDVQGADRWRHQPMRAGTKKAADCFFVVVADVVIVAVVVVFSRRVQVVNKGSEASQPANAKAQSGLRRKSQ